MMHENIYINKAKEKGIDKLINRQTTVASLLKKLAY